MKQKFTARTWKEGDWIIAQCAEVDIASHGRTEQEALANLQEALELHFEPPTATIVPHVSSIEVELGAAQPASYREIRRKLHAAGFTEISQKGSHVKFIRVTSDGTRTAIVPRHSDDVPLGTLRSILNQAGLTPDEFEKL